MEELWHVGGRDPWRGGGVYPKKPGPFIRATGGGRELVIGQWWLIAPNATERFPKARTNNARSEALLSRWSYKMPWLRGQRCIIPAVSFDEPCWETKKNVWWQFHRRDGLPWGLAGIWNRWTDKATGEQVESYSMLTLNANEHPLMNRMHRDEVDPKTGEPLPLWQQDKRSVVPIELADTDQWLHGTVEEAKALIRLPLVELFDAGPALTAPS